MKILAIGDIVGKNGRAAVNQLVPALRDELSIDFVIANGENMAGGRGLNMKTINDLTAAKLDVITTGDHIWDQRQFVGEIEQCEHVIRPANLPACQPGKGFVVIEKNGIKVAVINLLGQVFINTQSNNPFETVDKILSELPEDVKTIIVDFHAEATSEKIAMGRYLTGRVSAVFGTHTHVQTNDAEIFENSTAYITDVGMVGSKNSILGRKIKPVVKRFSTGIPASFDVEHNDIRFCGAVIEIDETTGRAVSIETVVKEVE